MRNVPLAVVVVVAVVFGCAASAQAAATTPAASAFDCLDDAQLMETLTRLDMYELAGPLIPDGCSPGIMLIRARIHAEAMRKITDPSTRLAAARRIIAAMKKALDTAKKEMDAAEHAADNATARTRGARRLAAAKAAYLYFDILYFLGDLSGRQAIEPYALKVMNLQDNREDRRIILEMTDAAVMDLQDMQDDFKDKLRDWEDDMSVWMLMGRKGESLLRDARYRSTWTYLYRALALGDAEAHKTRRRELLGRMLMQLPEFEKNKRSGVTHQARRLMALAHRELGEYSKAIDKLAPRRYEGASREMKMIVARELPITLVKQGKYSLAATAVTKFKSRAEHLLARGKKLSEIQQARIDLNVAMLKEYLYRQWAAASATSADNATYRAEGRAALIGFFTKYNNDGIRQFFIDFFGNRLLYAENVDKLSSMQLYIIAGGRGAAGKAADRRRVMLETILARKDDPAAGMLAASVHWRLGMVMNELGRNIDAANNFIAAIPLFGPDDPKSPRAAQYASACMDKYVMYRANRHRSIPRSVRMKCVEAMKHAISFDTKKHAELKLSQWYYPLGKHCDKLSGDCPEKDVALWIQQALDAFAKVPPEPRYEYVKAREYRLDLRYRALMRSKMGPKARAAAGKLRDDYKKLVEMTGKFIGDLPDKTSDAGAARIQELTEAGAWADFARAKLLAEQMGRQAAGLAEVETLLKNWAKVDSVIEAANQWKIQKLVDRNEIEEAGAALDAFLKDHGKQTDVRAGLIDRVIEGIRQAIDRPSVSGDKDPKRAALRKSYLQLARRQYAPVKGKAIVIGGKIDHERLGLTQLWIDALIQNDRGAEAIEPALECKRILDKRREVLGGRIEAGYAPRIRACKAAVGLPKVIAKLVKQFKDELTARSKDPGANDFNPARDARPVDMALAALKGAPANAPAAKRKRLMGGVSRELVIGYEDIIRRLKNRLTVDLVVEWNAAKCLVATGKYDDSLHIYKRLLNGTDPRTDKTAKQRFWRLQSEYCQAYIKAWSKKKKYMRRLVSYIEKELPTRPGGDSMGGFKAKFFSIAEQARRLSK
jgi:hypothetical protein